MQATINLHYLSSSESSHSIRSAKLKHNLISFLVAGSKNNILCPLLDKICSEQDWKKKLKVSQNCKKKNSN